MIQPQEPALPNPFRLGEWEIRRDEGLLCAGDRSVRLEPRVMDVLAHLAANSERVVSKEELLTVVWGGAFVEEGALAQAIHSLRKALGDDARQPRFIQTLPRRGYRLLGMIEAGEGGAGAEETSPNLSTARFKRSTLLNLVLVITLLISLALWVALKGSGASAETRLQPQGGIRIMVMPFHDIGRPGDPFFAAGLTGDVIVNLAHVPAIAVISGRDALGEKGSERPLSEIGEEFGVGYVLQGTVKWSADSRQVRVIASLTRVADNTIIWIDPVNGSTADLFKAQQDISRRLIERLNINLTPDQRLEIGARSTKNADAYNLYVRGRVLQERLARGSLEKAAQLFERAVAIDPKFAEAWANLSEADSYLAASTDPSPERSNRAHEASKRALALGNNGSYRVVHIASHSRNLGIPPWMQTGPRLFLLQREGKLPGAIAGFEHDLARDPKNQDLLWICGETYRAERKFEQADYYYKRALAVAPGMPSLWASWALNRRAWRGDITAARTILSLSPVRTSPELQAVEFQLDLEEGKNEQALARLSPEWLRKLYPEGQGHIGMLTVILYERLGRYQEAQSLAQANLRLLDGWRTDVGRRALIAAYRAAILAQMGRDGEAITEAERAANALRFDAFSGPRVLEIQAMIDARLGRRPEAISKLAWLLARSYRDSLTVADLRLNPVWDPLRGDMEFESLLQKSSSDRPFGTSETPFKKP